MPETDEAQLHAVLDYLGHELDPSILIGGWATFFRVAGDISYDIDLIIASQEVRDKVRAVVTGLSDSTHLSRRKWRGEVDGVHVDIYLPHESELGGKLRLRVEKLAAHTDDLGYKKWKLLTIEAHTISKVAALLDRPDSEKGFKDAREILRLLEKGVDPEVACAILAEATAGPVEDLPHHVATAFELLTTHAEPNKDQRRLLSRLRRLWVDAIAEVVNPVTHGRPPLT